MNIAGQTFKLSWTAPAPGDQVDSVSIYEHVGSSYNLIQAQPQPQNITTLTGVTPGVHNYVARAHNVSGESANSNEISVTVVSLPAVITLAFAGV